MVKEKAGQDEFLLTAIIFTWNIVAKKIKKTSASCCEIGDFVETHLCKLCGTLRSRVLRTGLM